MTKFYTSTKDIHIGDRYIVLRKAQWVWAAVLFCVFMRIAGHFFQFVIFAKFFPRNNLDPLYAEMFGYAFNLVTGVLLALIMYRIMARTVQRRNLSIDGGDLTCVRSNCRGIGAIRDKFTVLPQILQLLAAQSVDINQVTETAAQEIIENINTIDSAVQELSANVKKLLDVSADVRATGNKTVTSVASSLRSMSDYIEASNEEAQMHAQQINAVIKEAAALAKLTDLVKTIASQTNLLAINAAVEAARAGKHGSGFAVVSEEVRELSTHSEKAAIKIEEGINNLISSIERNMATIVDDKATKERADKLDAFAEDVASISALYQKVDSLNNRIITSMEKDSEAISAAVMNALSGVQFQDITRQRLEQIQDGLFTVSTYVKSTLQDVKSPEALEAIDNLDINEFKSRYRMYSQRKIHGEITGDDTQPEAEDLPDIELF